MPAVSQILPIRASVNRQVQGLGYGHPVPRRRSYGREDQRARIPWSGVVGASHDRRREQLQDKAHHGDRWPSAQRPSYPLAQSSHLSLQLCHLKPYLYPRDAVRVQRASSDTGGTTGAPISLASSSRVMRLPGGRCMSSVLSMATLLASSTSRSVANLRT